MASIYKRGCLWWVHYLVGGAAGYGMADDDDTEELLKALGLA